MADLLRELKKMGKAYNIDLAPEPLKKDTFELLVERGLIDIEDEKDNYLSIGYSPVRDDGISCIQAARMDENYRVEIIVDGYDGQPFHIYARNDVPFEEALELFYAVCVQFLAVDYMSWEDVTHSVKYLEKRY